MSSSVVPESFDPTDPDLIWEGVPHEQFRALRAQEPVHWVEQPQSSRDGMSTESGTGYWALSRHTDVSAVSKNSKDFSASENGAIIRFAEGMQREQIELQRVILINQDAPDHTATRQIISRGFTPRSIAALEEIMEQRAHQIVRDAVERGSGEFVEEIASELPLQAIADLIGVPQEDRRKLFDWSNEMLASDDPDYHGEPDVAAAEILGYAMGLAAERREQPRDDLITKLLSAEKDGRGLTDDEFGYFVILLTVAGNETTRNAITHGMSAFLDHPEQWELWCRERPATMIEEVIRWATPVSVFQRTALRDVEVGDVTVRQGQRVGLFYASANFDEDVFEDPFTFDITRDPNPHVSFGGHGAHYCIGANLARLEVRVIFEALADHASGIRRVEPARRLRHSWINGIKELAVAYR
ncbi:cholest-4-en-3-one 26-monooxygenase [Nocardioides marinisabuli]|uniref:Cholest-4-en-3-one 26-monooxygenase n=1 Tax=Nocardioides marinisabuli TaxID=419476 RepID=A0A7Y9F3Z6_9ACTN|nr:cytochrome P450 [Nocardioides marinisabuli]NYD59188.1 cholest-4-en-3-one 26-monooxygenase [Nocardioides marinisabuli]